jgi:hypothetical protein
VHRHHGRALEPALTPAHEPRDLSGDGSASPRIRLTGPRPSWSSNASRISYPAAPDEVTSR